MQLQRGAAKTEKEKQNKTIVLPSRKSDMYIQFIQFLNRPTLVSTAPTSPLLMVGHPTEKILAMLFDTI